VKERLNLKYLFDVTQLELNDRGDISTTQVKSHGNRIQVMLIHNL